MDFEIHLIIEYYNDDNDLMLGKIEVLGKRCYRARLLSEKKELKNHKRADDVNKYNDDDR